MYHGKHIPEPSRLLSWILQRLRITEAQKTCPPSTSTYDPNLFPRRYQNALSSAYLVVQVASLTIALTTIA